MQANIKTKSSLIYEGWVVTIAGTSALLALGVLYAWSVFKANIPMEWGWTETQKSLPYSTACVSLAVMVLVGARLLERLSPRAVVTLGGLSAGIGMIISSQSTSSLVFTLSFGLMVGAGIGLVYATTSPAALRWFPPSRTGLISGIVVFGFGVGSAWVAPLARVMIVSLSLQTTMLYLGIGMLIAVVFFAQFINYPPQDFKLANEKSNKNEESSTGREISPSECIKTWQFIFLWIILAFNSGAGLIIIGSLASIVDLQMGLAQIGGIAVSALSIGNGVGRVLYGILSDKIGRKVVLITSSIIQTSLIFILSFITKGSVLATAPVLLILVVIIGANYGANFAIFPSITKEYFGGKNFAMNFSMIFTAWGLGGFLLSQISSSILDKFNSFNIVYIVAASVLIVGILLTIGLKSPVSRVESQ